MITYTTRQVSVILDVDAQTIRKWAREGKLKATIRSKKEGYVFRKLSLDEFVYNNPAYATRYKSYGISETEARTIRYITEHPESIPQMLAEAQAIIRAIKQFKKEEP